MKNLAKSIQKPLFFTIFTIFLTACFQDTTLDEAIENLKELPALETDNEGKEEENIPGAA